MLMSAHKAQLHRITIHSSFPYEVLVRTGFEHLPRVLLANSGAKVRTKNETAKDFCEFVTRGAELDKRDSLRRAENIRGAELDERDSLRLAENKRGAELDKRDSLRLVENIWEAESGKMPFGERTAFSMRENGFL